MQLITAIHNAGYKVSDLHREFETRYAISYKYFTYYCRCNNSHCHNPEIWKEIKKFLEEKKIEWVEG